MSRVKQYSPEKFHKGCPLRQGGGVCPIARVHCFAYFVSRWDQLRLNFVGALWEKNPRETWRDTIPESEIDAFNYNCSQVRSGQSQRYSLTIQGRQDWSMSSIYKQKTRYLDTQAGSLMFSIMYSAIVDFHKSTTYLGHNPPWSKNSVLTYGLKPGNGYSHCKRRWKGFRTGPIRSNEKDSPLLGRAVEGRQPVSKVGLIEKCIHIATCHSEDIRTFIWSVSRD